MLRTLTLLLLLTLPAVGLAQGKLDQVREAVDRPSSPSRDKDCDDEQSEPSGSTDSSACSDGTGSGSPYEAIFLVVATPWTVPHMLFDPGTKVDVRFAPYPYSDPGVRYVVLDRPRDGAPSYFDLGHTNWWSVRASAEAGSDFSGLDRVGLRLFLDTNTRFGLKTDWDWYTEKLPCGCRDELWLGDVTATYRFVQCDWLMMHTGLGARFLVDAGRDRAGINFLYGFDAFPVQPVHLFGSYEGGTLGNATLHRVRGGVGANWSHGEVFAGYDFVRIGGVNLQGPLIGLRLWF